MATEIAPRPLDSAPPSATGHGSVSALMAALLELNAAPDLASGLARVAERVRHFVPYRSLGVLLLDERGREMTFAFAVGYPPHVAERWRFGMGQGIVGSVAQSGQPLRVGDVREEPRYIDAGEGLVAELAIPLRAGERIIGVLDVGSPEPHAFSEEHEGLLALLAGPLATAIENARLYQNTREQARSLSLLHEIGLELNTILDRRKLLERVAERLGSLVPYDRFLVMSWHDGRQRLEPWVVVSPRDPTATASRSLELGEGICGTAAALRQPVRVANVHLDPRFVSCSGDLPVRSELVAPLVFRDRLLGVLDLESTAYDAFSQHHEQLLATLAAGLSVALENARLVERLQEDDRRLRDDLATARQIQRQLLPRSSPWVAGLQVGVAFEPARQLGGDFYDFFDYGEGRVAFALGDVAGKATAAALYGSFAVGLLRELVARDRPSPGPALEALNGKLRGLGFDNRFLAMLFGLYDGPSHRLQLANSGLPLPFLVRGGAVERPAVAGTPLGLLAGRRYEEWVGELAPSDLLVLASDGLEESTDAKGAELGGARVAAALPSLARAGAREVSQALLDLARRHSGGEAADDLTVITLCRTGG